ncbi:MAG: DUF3793 family protein [Clostridia bacterium]|nr:DUF3793 family protein [Clostridia bacterium]
MPEDLLIRYCAPTLAGLKTASLFACPYDTAALLRADLRLWNARLGPKGLRVLPLRYREGRAQIFLYRPQRLREDLQSGAAQSLLRERGYAGGSAERCLIQLMERVRRAGRDDFPHEIGLFLGYPPEDVWGFLEQGPGACKCAGLWKVYGNEEKARALFAAFDACTQICLRRWDRGATVEQLTAAE